MNIGTITTTNSKGQLVIPSAIRKALNITPKVHLQIKLHGNSALITPVKDVVLAGESDDSYLQILKQTAGSWGTSTKTELAKARNILKAGVIRKSTQSW